MKARRQRISAEGGKPARISVTVPSPQHDLLESIADEKQVSVAWVVRDAINQYLADRWPLLSTKQAIGDRH